ncbi:helix-turn-helix transcriptional regulator [Chloroflexota bacterium]|jgi:transcriptional regulator with XRE-family HTH domain
MAQLRRADTPLAEWLAHAMARWVNPETQMPGISQRKMAEETGISQTQLHEILKKGHSPGPDILKKLAEFFEVNPLALFRLAYFEEDDEAEVDPEVSAKFLELFLEMERLLAKLPGEEQLEYFDGFVKEAKALALLVEEQG